MGNGWELEICRGFDETATSSRNTSLDCDDRREDGPARERQRRVLVVMAAAAAAAAGWVVSLSSYYV
jgi:hypothetical protein